MLNIGKLGAGGERYYLDTVASGVEDYYVGSGEAPGVWLGSAAGSLGLSGAVDGEGLRAVLGAADPSTGQRLTRAGHRRVPGFDLTFRAPKSVSVLYGLAEAEVAGRVVEAHDAAVRSAVAFLEREAGFSRRGTDGVEQVAVTGFVAAAFRHRSSRAGDPLVHTHVLVANLGQAVDDGGWRTLDARGLYRHAKSAGYVYQAALRHELSTRLGVEWGEVRNGCADLAGIPRSVLRAFSRRRVEIEARLAERGESSARAAQVATHDTRRAKDRDVDAATLRQRWAARAQDLGVDADLLAGLVERATPRVLDAAAAERILRELAGPQGLSAHASTFSAAEVLQACLERLPAGAPVEQAETLAGAVLDPQAGVAVRLLDPQPAASGEVIRRRDGRLVPVRDEPRYASPELLALEASALESALEVRDGGAGVAAAAAVERALADRPALADEQAAMVRRLATSGAGVEVVVGKAGAGKTFALDAARAAWQESGYTVVGCALAARAAAELEAGAGIDSYTIDGLLADLDRAGSDRWLGHRTVVVVDEAGMVGTRKLARLLDHARTAHAKVVLVGDHHQLPEIDAGGLFRALAARLDPITLADNRRQTQPWERAALDQLRHGDPDAAIHAYTAHGRVVLADTAHTLRERLVDDWWDASGGGPDARVVMIAARRSDVADLNQRARERMADAGLLTGPELMTADGDKFQAGDRVVALRNDQRLSVVNGTRGTITHVDTEQGTVVLRSDDGRALTLPADYLDAGHLTHGYAITGHKAQGLTVDNAFVLGSEAIYREWGYVALSRARHDTRLYLVDHRPAEHGTQAHDDALRALARGLRRSDAKHLAHDHGRPEVRRRDQIRHQIEQAETRVADLEDQLADTEERLTALKRGGGRITRKTDIENTEAVAERQRGDLTAWQQRLDQLTTELAALDIAEHGQDEPRPLTPVETLEAKRRTMPVLEEIVRPSSERPDTPTERARWRRALAAQHRTPEREPDRSAGLDIA